MGRIECVGLQSHFMLQGISLGTRVALVNGGEIYAKLTCTLLCCWHWIVSGDGRLQTVDEGKVRCCILKDRNSACFNEVTDAFCLPVLTCKSPFIPIATLLCISIRHEDHLHDLANLLECWVELSLYELPASSTQRLVVQRYFNFWCSYRRSDTEHREGSQKDGEHAQLEFHFSNEKDHWFSSEAFQPLYPGIETARDFLMKSTWLYCASGVIPKMVPKLFRGWLEFAWWTGKHW